MARKPTSKAPAPTKAGTPKQKKKKAPPHIRAIVDRAEARAKGETPTKPKVAIDPVIKPEKPKRRWRPFDQDLADELCEQIAAGGSVRAFTLEPGRPHYCTIYKWLRENEEFANQYARAREDQADTYADSLAYIAETDEDVARARLKIDTMKWVASKLKPKKYGDFKAVELTGAAGGPVLIEETGELDQARRVALALGRALERQKLKVIDGAVG